MTDHRATAAARRLRPVLLDAGFTTDGLLARLGAGAFAALGRGEPVAARRALGDADDDQATAARLFVLGEHLPGRAVARALPVDDLVAAGLLGDDGAGRVRAVVDVRPYGEPDTDWYVVSDHGPDSAGRAGPQTGAQPTTEPATEPATEPTTEPATEVAADHVLGVGGASLTLARITPRRPVGRALDVGTGCGVQALHLGRHAGDVVATDRNRRALRLAAVSAALSGQDWDLREGSLFDPVAGERFDLVVSNPPFVISPGHRYTYRDAGLPADDLGRVLVQRVPAHLLDGGTAVLLANWLHVRGEDWQERVAGWVEGTGCDAWVAQREVQDPLEYVELWLRDAGATDDATHARRYGEWLDALADMAADGVGFGWIVLHRGGTYGRQGPLVEDVAEAPRLPDGAEVAGLIAGRATWAEVNAVDILGSTPRRAPGLRLTTAEIANDGGLLARAPVSLDLARGWRRGVPLDRATEALLRHLDGARTLSQVIDLAAADTALDVDDLTAHALIVVRRLLAAGLLRG